ncbi:MAG: hypothetical protein K6F68_02000 [Clostridiales bacterium]|nr:hypothetical protein [Clostridiales bacterium]
MSGQDMHLALEHEAQHLSVFTDEGLNAAVSGLCTMVFWTMKLDQPMALGTSSG